MIKNWIDITSWRQAECSNSTHPPQRQPEQLQTEAQHRHTFLGQDIGSVQESRRARCLSKLDTTFAERVTEIQARHFPAEARIRQPRDAKWGSEQLHAPPAWTSAQSSSLPPSPSLARASAGLHSQLWKQSGGTDRHLRRHSVATHLSSLFGENHREKLLHGSARHLQWTKLFPKKPPRTFRCHPLRSSNSSIVLPRSFNTSRTFTSNRPSLAPAPMAQSCHQLQSHIISSLQSSIINPKMLPCLLHRTCPLSSRLRFRRVFLAATSSNRYHLKFQSLPRLTPLPLRES